MTLFQPQKGFCTRPTSFGIKSFAEESSKRRYFDSLREHRKDMKEISMEEIEQDNELKNYDAQLHSEKTKNAMTQEEKDLVHNEIDLKMQELEDTGLTRMEILYNVEKGIPLQDDPVFQYLKHNRIAREMLVKATEVFTADAVIERALRQDLEPDPTMAKLYSNKKSIKEDFDPLRHYKQKYKDNFPLINEESYIYGIDTINEVMDEKPGLDIDYRK